MSSADPVPRWPRTVQPERLSWGDYKVATETIRERLLITVRVCDALRDAEQIDSIGPRRAYHELVGWLAQRYEVSPSDETATGMGDIVVPDDHTDHVRFLESANRVCRALSLVWSASILEYPRDVANVRQELDGFDHFASELLRGPLFADTAWYWLEDLLRRNDENEPDAEDDDEDEQDDEERLDALLCAPRPWGELDEPAEPNESWQFVRPIAEKVFPGYGSVQRWAHDAWRALGCAGLTHYDTEVERARVACRVLCLHALYQEFDVRAFDNGTPGDWSLNADPLVGKSADALDPVILGVLAEREGVDLDVDVDGGSEHGSDYDAIDGVVRAQCGEVAAALRREQGDGVVFASLWAADRKDVVYPLSDEAVREIVNYDLSEDKMVAYQWIDEGMPVYV